MNKNIKIFIIVVFVLLLTLPLTADAAWNPSYIIRDDKFIAQTMTEAQIQSFLVAQNSYLKSYSVRTPYSVDGHLTSNKVGPDDTVDCTGWTISHLIYMVSQWYGLNPQVILTTLQKEQSLVTNSSLNQYGINWAMGYGVPDSGNRDYSYAGIARQIDYGGWQLRKNMDRANSHDSKICYTYCYWTGTTIPIDGVATYLGTGATASLYSYTPHFHGNQNFRLIFTNWFGSIDYLLSVYRFYNRSNGSHFYTASETEKNTVIAKWSSTYRFEGVAYNLRYESGRNTLPLYRFYNFKVGSHFYTASLNEKNTVITKWPGAYRYEGIAWYVSNDPNNSLPIYRFYNRVNGSHFYTSSVNEKNTVIAKWSGTYRYEGIAFYIPY